LKELTARPSASTFQRRHLRDRADHVRAARDEANVVNIEQRIAMEKDEGRRIGCRIVCGGKPYKSVSAFKTIDPSGDGRLCQAAAGRLSAATLTAKDYPNLIAEEKRSIPSPSPPCLRPIWAPNTDRYRKLALFVDVFSRSFRLPESTVPSKWKEVSLSAPLADCSAFRPPSYGSISTHRAVSAQPVDEFLKQGAAAGALR